jgi:hypothetical protein
MKLLPLTKSLLILSVPAFTGGAFAGSANFDFNTDPTGILTLFNNSTWRPSGGVGGTGYMSITDAANDQSGTIVFDDFDNGAIVNAFTFSCDLRTGGGTGNPADGYSVNFTREGDPTLTTGGDFPQAHEEGTRSGLSICLDEWDSNPGVDVVGISVRVDGVSVSDFAMPTRNGSSTDLTSLQTGPENRQPDPVTFDVADHSFVNLTVKLDPDGTVDVSYKGQKIVDNLATPYFPSAGRLVFAGRTGGANSNHHVDNIVINTTASTLPVLTASRFSPSTLTAEVTDSAESALDITKAYTVKIDGNVVAATVQKSGLISTFTYVVPGTNYFTAGVHPVEITARDTDNNPLLLKGSGTVAPYTTLDAAWKAAPGQVDTVTPARQLTMLANVHQLSFGRTPGDSNLLPLPERQIQNGYFDEALGTIAPNVANPADFDNPLTFQKVIAGVLNWDQAAGALGNFIAANGFPDSLIPGIPGVGDDNIAGEIFTWLDLPAGATRLGVNSDDGFTLSVGASPLDFFGKATAGVFNGGRGASDTQFDLAVPAAGLYPVRLLWWEGGGGANLEFFSVKPDGTRVLINDSANPDAIKSYYYGLPVAPSIHAIAPYPGSIANNLKHPLTIELVDGVNPVNDGSIVVLVDGAPVTPTITNGGNSTLLSYLPTANDGAWTGGNHTVSLTYNTTPATVSRTETWSFMVKGLTYAWQGGGTNPNDITDPTNWSNSIAPPNDGTNINLPAGQVITFATNNLTIPDDSGRQINLAVGAQIVSDKGGGGDCRVNARVNAQGTGADGNGSFYVEGGGWGMPNNFTLVGDTTTTANGNRLRMNDGANRLDLAGFTMTTKGNNENNFVNTNIVGTAGSRMVLQNFTAFEGATRLDPNVTVEMAAGVTLSSWGGQGARRDSAIVLNNNGAIETRFDDDDLTFSGPVNVATGNTGILRANIHTAGEPAERNGQDLRLNILGPLTGAGTFRKDGEGTLLLSGAGTNTGGLIINGANATVLASDTAAGTGPITVATASTLSFTNGGGQEFVDSAGRADLLDDVSKTGFIDPALSGVNSRQALGGNRRTSYTGKLNNPTDSNLLVTFAEQYDDDSYVEIDGNVVLSDGAWNIVTTGQISLTPGTHDFRVSMRDGGGGSGTNNGQDNAFPGWDQMGIGYSFNLPDDGAGGVNASKAVADYTKLGTNYEVYQPVNRSIANAVIINTTTTITTAAMNGYDATISGNLSGAGSLIVTGSPNYTTDELILSGTGTNTGSTTVDNGTLIVNGNFSAATGAVTVNAGATLGGNGTLGGVTTVSGGIAPGSGGIGTLNIAANTTWVAGNSWIYELGATTVSDRLAITGNFTKGAGSNFAFDFSNTGAAGTYTLATWTGTTNFVAGDFSANNLGGGNTGAFALVGNSLVLNVTAGGYAAWAANAFTAGTAAGDRLAAADPDKDGITNLMEYALNTNPSAASAGPAPETTTVGVEKFLQIRWTRPNDRTDITTSGQVSTDLTPALNWVTGAGNVTTTITPAGAGQEEVIIRAVQPIGTGARRFIRAMVSQAAN